MSNFTKSVLYSTTVLAAGLVAIFAIYNNVTTNEEGAVVAQIAPAAGNEDTLAVQYEETSAEASGIVSDATVAVLGAAETVGSHINTAVETAESTLAEAGDAVADAMDDLAPASGEEAVEAEEPVEEHAEEAVEAEHAEETPAVEDEVAEETATEDEAPAAVEGEEEVTEEGTVEEHTEEAH